MGSISKSFPLLLIVLLAVSSLIIAKPIFAQTPTPTPSVPIFTLKFVAQPYYVAPTTTIDPYSGENVTTQAGYYTENQSIEITIQNQPYSYSYNGSSVWVEYNVQVKGHFADSWTTPFEFDQWTGGNLPIQSSSGFTVISVPAGNYPVGGEVDIRVQALSVSQATLIDYPNLGTTIGAYGVQGYRIEATSDWSNTQTITIPASSTSSSPSPTPVPSSSTSTLTPTPTLTSVSSASYASLLLITTIAVVVIAFLLAVIIFLLLHMRKRKPINSIQRTVSNSGM